MEELIGKVMPWLLFAATLTAGLWVVVKQALKQIGEMLPGVDKAEQAYNKMVELDPLMEKVKAWANPEDNRIPPSPGNPTGNG